MISFKRNQDKEDMAENLIQEWKKACKVAKEKSKAKFSPKEKRFRENWTFEYPFKQRIGDEDKRNKH